MVLDGDVERSSGELDDTSGEFSGFKYVVPVGTLVIRRGILRTSWRD